MVHGIHAIDIALNIDISLHVDEQLPDFFQFCTTSYCSCPHMDDPAAASRMNVGSSMDKIAFHFCGLCFEDSIEQQAAFLLNVVIDNLASRT